MAQIVGVVLTYSLSAVYLAVTPEEFRPSIPAALLFVAVSGLWIFCR